MLRGLRVSRHLSSCVCRTVSASTKCCIATASTTVQTDQMNLPATIQVDTGPFLCVCERVCVCLIIQVVSHSQPSHTHTPMAGFNSTFD